MTDSNSGLLHPPGRPLAERVGSAVNVGIIVLVMPDDSLQDRLRHLHGGRAVQVYQVPAVDGLRQNGKVFSNF